MFIDNFSSVLAEVGTFIGGVSQRFSCNISSHWNSGTSCMAGRYTMLNTFTVIGDDHKFRKLINEVT
jgi:hypothetical protein